MAVSDYLEADPFNDMPLDAEDIDLLVNRAEVKARLSALLDSAGKGYPQNISILGEDGIGKTSLINFAEAKARLVPDLFTSRLDVTERTENRTVVRALLSDLLNQIELGLGNRLLGLLSLGPEVTQREFLKRLQGTQVTTTRQLELSDSLFQLFHLSHSVSETRSSPEDLFQLLEMLKETLTLMRRKPKAILILFDEGQYVAQSQSLHLLQQMRLLFQRRPYMLLVAGSADLFARYAAVEPSFNNLFPEQNRLRLTALEDDHIRELLTKRLAPVRKKGKGIEPFQQGCVERLTALSEGNPRYVIRIASASLHLGRDRQAITPVMLEEAWRQIVQEIGRDRFDKLSDDEREMILILARYQPLNISQIHVNLKSAVDLSTVSRRIAALADKGYLTIETQGKQKLSRLRRAIYQYAKSLL